MTQIHPTAIVDPQAELDPSVSGRALHASIGPHVRIGAGTTIGPHCVIEGRTTIGRDNRIFQFASLGAIPQDKKYAGEPCELVIGDRNTDPRVLHLQHRLARRRRRHPGGQRQLDHGLRAHRARLPASATTRSWPTTRTLAGHVRSRRLGHLGGFTGVHQFVRIGAHAHDRLRSARCSQDVPPFMLVDGNPLASARLDELRWACAGASSRRSASRPSSRCTRLLYREGRTLEQARSRDRAAGRRNARGGAGRRG